MEENVANRLANFLAEHKLLAEAWPVWDNGRMPLREHTYLSLTMPPDDLITSARAILFRGDEVMVIHDHKDEPYVVPGGRRDLGETVLETLRRELLEETGWSLLATAVLGFVHFHHLGAKPPGHTYAYPDFIQVIYTAVADQYYPAALKPDPYVTLSAFQPIEAVMDYDLKESQKILLQAAVKNYRSLNGS